MRLGEDDAGAAVRRQFRLKRSDLEKLGTQKLFRATFEILEGGRPAWSERIAPTVRGHAVTSGDESDAPFAMNAP